jgi:hypothetical protein
VKPHKHASSSEFRHGPGKNYQAVHDFMDMTKIAHASMRHRSILHNQLGAWLAGLAFGEWATEIALEHIIEDIGRIPTTKECETLVPRLPRKKKMLMDFQVSSEAEFIMSRSHLLHNSVGPFILEKILGPTLRQHGEDFIIREYGYIPSLDEMLHNTSIIRINRANGMSIIKKISTSKN